MIDSTIVSSNFYGLLIDFGVADAAVVVYIELIMLMVATTSIPKLGGCNILDNHPGSTCAREC